MRKEKYELYIQQIVDTILLKRKYKTGYLVAGEKLANAAILQDIIKELERKKIASYHVNFNQFDDEESCIAALKKTKKRYISKGKRCLC